MAPLDRRELFLRAGAAAGGFVCASASPYREAAMDERDAVLRELLARNLGYHPQFEGRLANHLSMALIALHALGADGARMRAFSAKYEARLGPFPGRAEPLAESERAAALGRVELLPRWVATFEREIAERGAAATLRANVPTLVPSLATAAFHCLIRTAYAVRADVPSEIAHALGYWASHAVELAPLAGSGGSESDPAALFERARRDLHLGQRRLSGSSVAARMTRAAASPGFAAIAGALEVGDATLASLAAAARELFVATEDFTALHAVTATQAFRVVEPFVGERERALAFHWQGLLAAYASIGTPELAPRELAAPAAWDALAARAVASDDDHDVKLADACREERLVFGNDERYRVAVALRLGAI